MEAFDLEKAKDGYTVCTRQGIPVRILCFDANIEHYSAYPIVGLINGKNGDILTSFTSEGKYYDFTDSENDLMLTGDAPQKTEIIEIIQPEISQFVYVCGSKPMYKVGDIIHGCECEYGPITKVEYDADNDDWVYFFNVEDEDGTHETLILEQYTLS